MITVEKAKKLTKASNKVLVLLKPSVVLNNFE